MNKVLILPAPAKYFKNINDKKLKSLYKNVIRKIAKDYTIGTMKKGDLQGTYAYDIYYGKTNDELAYRVESIDEEIVIVIIAGTQENFYEQLKKYIK